MIDENGTDPWVEDGEQVEQASEQQETLAAPTGTSEAFAALTRATSQDERDARGPHLPSIMSAPQTAGEYAARMTPKSMTEAEQMLLQAQYDFEIASEDVVASAMAYSDAESQQARTKLRVIEKLMSNTEDAASRVQNAKKKEDSTLSFSAADRIASGHPEYTAVRDDVAEKLNLKTEAENRCKVAEQRVLTLREIMQNRRRFGFVSYFERELASAGGKASSAPAPRAADLSDDERKVAEKKDSRALDGIERIDNERPRFRPPATVFGHEDESIELHTRRE